MWEMKMSGTGKLREKKRESKTHILLIALMLMTLVANSNNTRPRRCGSVDITGRPNVRLPEKYRSCQVMEGHLRIQLAEDYEDEEALINDLSFPELVQVTEFVMIYRVSPVRSLDALLPNLSVIRGNNLFHGYALIVFANTYLEMLGLNNLTDILNGSVRIEKNWILCPGMENRWHNITKPNQNNEVNNVITKNYVYCIYDPCEMTDNCKTELKPLNKICSTVGGGCYQGPMCHEECAGGCSKINDPSACVACKHFLRNDTCVSSCADFPSHNVTDKNYLCIEEAKCIGKIKMQLVVKGGPVIPVCDHCNDGNCSKDPCVGTNITSNNLGKSLKDCTKVTGSLIISVAGGWNVTQQLEENLKNIKEVTGYIRVYGSNTLFSLNFLKKLEIIGGEEKVYGQYALYVLENEHLQELWDFNQRSRNLTIGNNGSIFFHYNPSLCPKLIYELATIAGVANLSIADVSNSTNGETQPCYEFEMVAEAYAVDEVGAINVTWTHKYRGNDNRFVIGYYVFYREAPKNVTLFGGRDACNDKVLWERNFWEYEDVETRTETLKGLKSYTRYAIYVMAYYTDREKNGNRSKILYATTNATNPSPVWDIKLKQTAATNITLCWKAPSKPNGVVSKYEIKYEEVKRPTYVPNPEENVCDLSKLRVADSDAVFSVAEIQSQQATANDTEAGMTSTSDTQLDTATASRCCACQNHHHYSYSSLMKDDRQFKIAFENYLNGILYSKM